MSLSNWDKFTAPSLRLIETLSSELYSRARALEIALHDLPAKPTFPTKAEAALADAEKAVDRTLSLLRKARGVYHALPSGAERSPSTLIAAE